MPTWIHDRVERLRQRKPTMPESEAWAIATQQSHALGKSPKGYGTAEGRRTAKAKYKTPGDDVKTANYQDIVKAAFFDELEKIGMGTPPPLPAAARAVKGVASSMSNAMPRPKLYGEEGFQALMQGAKASKSNPFAKMFPAGGVS